MPEILNPEATSLPADSLTSFLRGVVSMSFDPTLLERQHALTFYGHDEHLPVKPDTYIELGGLLQESGAVQLTYVGNVEKILSNTYIGVGAHVGSGCVLKGPRIEAGAVVEPYSVLEHGTVVGPQASLGEGVKLWTQASVGERSIVGSGASINFDVAVPADTKIDPFGFQY